MAAARNPLRRWKPFLAAFTSVDGAIEAADPGGLPRDEIRRARGRIVEMLRGAEGEAEAEGLCLVLDVVMAESLLTLRLVPVTARTLATTDLAGVVGALRRHESERIRGLATDIVRGWRAAVRRELVRIGIAMEKLSQTPERIEADQRVRVTSDLDTKVKHATPTSLPKRIEADQRVRVSPDLDMKVKHASPAPPPKKKATAVGSSRVDPAKTSQLSLTKTSAPVVGVGRVKAPDIGSATKPNPPKKLPAVTGSAGGRRDGIKPSHIDGEKLTVAAKRKLGVYQEAEEAQKPRKTADMGATAKPKEPALPPKKSPAVVASAGRRESIELRNDDEKIAAAKRKLHEGYREAEEAKKRRKMTDVGAAAKPKEPALPPKKLPAVVANAGRRESIELRNDDEEKIAAAKQKLHEGYREAEEAKNRRKMADMGAAAKPKEPAPPPKKSRRPSLPAPAAARAPSSAMTTRGSPLQSGSSEKATKKQRRRSRGADMGAAAKPKEPALPPKKSPAVVASAGRREGIELRNEDEKIAAAKRKLREGYQEAEEAKKRRKIHVIEDPEILKQRQKKMHPILRLRSRASHASSMAEKSSLMSSLGRL
uniref:TFIIS N-terminal domain-containing protein n=1 Tax=Oryza meridionalis TaxID=40149 RepID=A0A0E0CZ72_9ORYZ